jgi:TolB-like protein/Tfp pilus assembly protein PilF
MTDTSAVRPGSGLSRFPPHWRLFSAAVFGLLLLTLWLRLTAPTPAAPPVKVAARPNSIAVLPFINTNPDSTDDYLGVGLASGLTRTLSRLAGIRVADQASAFSEWGDPLGRGRRLQVGTVLEGTLRRVGDQLRVTARLVDVNQGFELWSETYDRRSAEVLQVQEEIVRAVAATLRLPVADSAALQLRRPTSSSEAYDAYMVGRYRLGRSGPNDAAEAVANFTRAIRLDSSFAVAYAALAEAQMPRYQEELPPRLTLLTAESAARTALQLDSTLAGPHRTLGEIRWGYSRDWPGAEAEFRRAIELAPSGPDAHQAYARFLFAMDRRAEALALGQRAVELSPLSPAARENLGWLYVHARDFDRAREALARSIQLDSTNWRPHFDLMLLEQAATNYGQARAHLERATRRALLRLDLRVSWVQLLALSGQADSARAYMQGFHSPFWRVPPYLEACMQAALGDRAKAFASLEQAVAERSELVPYLRIDPRLDPLRADPRFARLVRRLRLP